MIKTWLFNQKYKRLLDSRRSAKVDKINTINSVTVLCHADLCSAAQLRSAGDFFEEMDIKAMLYLVEEKNTISESEDIITITREDFNWYQIPKQSAIVKWLKQKTDLLIVINPANHDLISYLTAATNSKLIAVASGEREKKIGHLILDDTKANRQVRLICENIYTMLLNIGMKTPVLG